MSIPERISKDVETKGGHMSVTLNVYSNLVTQKLTNKKVEREQKIKVYQSNFIKLSITFCKLKKSPKYSTNN